MSYIQPRPQISNLRKATLLGAVGFGGILVASEAATAFIAYRLGYHPALGQPLFQHVYAPWDCIVWARAPWAAGAAKTFQLAKAGAGVTAMAGMLGAMLLATKGRRRPVKHEGIHGTAHFMTDSEVKDRSGLLASKGKDHAGVYIGGWTDRKGQIHYLRHDGPEHCIVVAPTRSGKGVGNILPTLLSWPASAIVYDEKGELWALTAGWRAQHAGNTVVRWEPGALEGSAGFNFLEEIRLGTPYEVSDAQNVAQMLCDPNGDGIEGKDYWSKSAFDLLSATMLHVMYTARANGRTAGFSDLAFVLSDPNSKADHLWDDMLTNKWFDGKTHMVIAAAGRDMLDRSDKERSGVLSSTKVYLSLFRDPMVAANTSQSDFRLIDLMNHEKPLSLYIVTRGADKERLRPLVRLMLTMAMRTLMGVPLQYDRGQPVMPHKWRLLMMLDEFPSLGKMQVIQDVMPKCAGYGIKMFLAAQNREQMFGAYGPHQSITGNCHIRIIYAPNELESARWISDVIGQATIVKEDISESGTRGGALKNVNRAYHEVGRALMTPSEIMELRKPRKNDAGEIVESGEMVVFVAGEPPIKGTQILYYMDETFLRRSRIAAPPSGTTTRTFEAIRF